MNTSKEKTLLSNVLENSDFEELDPYYNLPSGNNYIATPLIHTNASYQDNVHAGSYAGMIQENATFSPYLILISNQFQNCLVYLNESIQLQVYYYMETENGIKNGGVFSFSIFIRDTQTFQNYVLEFFVGYGESFSTFNYSNHYFFLRNSTANQWNYFSEDLSALMSNLVGTPLDQMYIYGFSFALTPPDMAFMRGIIDDAHLLNALTKDYFEPNSDFEQGNGQNWSFSTMYSPAYVSTSTDAPSGKSSLNLTSSVITSSSVSEASMYRYLTYPAGYYNSLPNGTFLRF